MLGTDLGHYRITAKLGEGGMGVVYRAADTKLHRDVALKFLPEDVANDPGRRHRFEREAQLLAALNHPNIAAVYGFEERAIVMELVEGPTLAGRISNGGAIPVDEALAIARQIADALEAAHEKGIVHRDLKPANVKLTAEGQVKVLDFGLAKAMDANDRQDSDPANSPTLVAGRSAPGMILGTAAYMSPEQARGAAVDKRTDIWAFGVVLWEMLTGKRLFEGETISDTLVAVLKAEPDFGIIPEQVRPLLRKCLQRDKKKRLRDIGDAFLFEEAVPAPVVRMTRWVTPVVLAAGLIGGWLLRNPPPPTEPPLRSWSFTPKNLSSSVYTRPAVISPDGRRIAYVAENQLWVLELATDQARVVEGTEGAEGPFWSPDSTQVGFAAEGGLKKVAVAGGRPFSLAALEGLYLGGAWSPDGGTILASVTQHGLREVPAGGGAWKQVVALTGGTYFSPQYLSGPAGKRLILAGKGNFATQTLELLDLSTGRGQTLRDPGAIPSWSPTGHVLHQTNVLTPGVWALRHSPGTGDAVTEQLPVLNKGSGFSVSDDDTMVWVDFPPGEVQRLVWRDRAGKKLADVSPVSSETLGVTISADGTHAAYSATNRGNRDIWIVDLARGLRTRFTFAADVDHAPIWSPSGKEIAFRNGNLDVAINATGGTGEPHLAVAGPLLEVPEAWSPDGTTLLFYREDPQSKGDIWAVRRKSDGTFGQPAVWLQSEFDERYAGFSPDGRYVGYISDESGQYEVYVRPLAGEGGKHQISTTGGSNPRWSRDGREIFYTQGDSLMAATVTITGDGVRSGTPVELFRSRAVGVMIRPFDVHPDGKRFLIAEPAEAERKDASIHVIQNWPALLRGKSRP